MRLEMIESVFQGKKETVTKYQSVEGTDKGLVIDTFVAKFSGRHDSWSLRSLLETHDEFRLGDELFRYVYTDKELQDA